MKKIFFLLSLGISFSMQGECTNPYQMMLITLKIAECRKGDCNSCKELLDFWVDCFKPSPYVRGGRINFYTYSDWGYTLAERQMFEDIGQVLREKNINCPN